MSWWKDLLGIQESKSTLPPEKPGLPKLSPNEDPLYPAAAEFVLSSGRTSMIAIQSHLKIGFNRTTTLIEALENDCIVSALSSGERHVLSQAEREKCLMRPSKSEILRQRQEQETALRLSYLLEKYSDEAIVANIMKSMIWEGMTAGHLFDSLGEPDAMDQKYLKKVSREVWKYTGVDGKGFYLKVILENGIVVGWEKNS
ncbi:DNA translocase FtsK [Pseudomonas putida]